MRAYQVLHLLSKDIESAKKEIKVTNASNGVSEDEINEIEAFCNLKIDELKNSQIDEYDGEISNEDIDGFIQQYSFLKLRSNSPCICLISNNGGGRFLCHAVIYKDDLYKHYPVEYIGSDIFIKYVSEGNLENIMSSKMKAIEDMKAAELVDFNKISSFIKATKGYALRYMLNAVVSAGNDGKEVYIYDKADRALFWLGAILMAFHIEMALGLEFSIELYNASERQNIIKFLQSDNDNEQDNNIFNEEFYEDLELTNSKYYMKIHIYNKSSGDTNNGVYSFDFINRENYIPKEPYRFTRIIDMGYLVKPDVINSFHDFLKAFSFSKINSLIESGYNLYLLSNYGVGNMEGDCVKDAVDFALINHSDAAYMYLSNVIRPQLDKINMEITIDNASSIFELLFSIAGSVKSMIFSEKVYEIFFFNFDRMIFDYNCLEYDELFDIFLQVEGYNEERIQSFRRHLISKEHIDYLLSKLEGLTIVQSSLYIKIIFYCLVQLGYSWNQALLIEGFDTLLEQYINMMIKNRSSFTDVLKVSSKDNEIFSTLIIEIYNKLTDIEMVQAIVDDFIICIKDLDEENISKIRRHIYTLESGSKFLFNAFSSEFKEIEDKKGFFHAYYKNIFYSMINYSKEYYPKAAKLYISSLEENEIYDEAIKLLKYAITDNSIPDRDDFKKLIEIFEKKLPLSKPDKELADFIVKLKKLKKDQQIYTSPDLTCLLEEALWIEDFNGDEIDLKPILENSMDIADVDAERVSQYMDWCLPMFVDNALGIEEHKYIFRLFDNEEIENEFIARYIEAIGRSISKDDKKGYKIIRSFIICFLYYKAPKYINIGNELAAENIIESIIDILCKQKEAWLYQLDIDIKNEFEERRVSIPVQWGDIYKRVHDYKNKSIFKKIKNVFGR